MEERIKRLGVEIQKSRKIIIENCNRVNYILSSINKK